MVSALWNSIFLCSEKFVNLQEQPEVHNFFQILVLTSAYSGFYYYYFCLLKSVTRREKKDPFFPFFWAPGRDVQKDDISEFE